MLKEKRKQKNMSQEELSIALGVSQSMISKWERGENFPRGKILIKLAETLSCSVDELLREEDK